MKLLEIIDSDINPDIRPPVETVFSQLPDKYRLMIEEHCKPWLNLTKNGLMMFYHATNALGSSNFGRK